MPYFVEPVQSEIIIKVDPLETAQVIGSWLYLGWIALNTGDSLVETAYLIMGATIVFDSEKFTLAGSHNAMEILDETMEEMLALLRISSLTLVETDDALENIPFGTDVSILSSIENNRESLIFYGEYLHHIVTLGSTLNDGYVYRAQYRVQYMLQE